MLRRNQKIMYCVIPFIIFQSLKRNPKRQEVEQCFTTLRVKERQIAKWQGDSGYVLYFPKCDGTLLYLDALYSFTIRYILL